MFSNAVSTLNEYAQKKRATLPVYNLVCEMGEPHNKLFRMECVFMSHRTEGTDKTKQEAKRKAAEEMVLLLRSKDGLPRSAEVQQRLLVVQRPEVLVRNVDANLITNPIGWLQEYCMKKTWKIPQYEDLGLINNVFHYQCTVRHLVVTGSGFRKQLAKSRAALNMCHLINGTTDNQPQELEKATIRKTPPSSPLNINTDSLDYDSVDSPFEETSPEQNGDVQGANSISFLHQLVMASKIPKPEFEHTNLEEITGCVFMCFCNVITLETFGSGRNKIEAKGKAAEEMVNLIFVNAGIEDTNNFSEKNSQKALEYLQNLKKKYYGGGDEMKIDEVAKKWLELRKKFPSAKVKPKKVSECKVRHCFYKNLKGDCIGRLRNSSTEELVAEGMDFLRSLGEEQHFTFQKKHISCDGKEQLCIITLDAEVPLAFYGSDKKLIMAEQKKY